MAAPLSGRQSVVIGATNGIGRGMAVWLAQQGASVVVAGRSRERGQEVVAELRAVAPAVVANTGLPPKFEFAQVDAASIADTQRFADELIATHDHLDYLVITAGIATMQGRTETTEGLDQKLAVHYYGRIAAVVALLPLLEKTASVGHDARVLTVLSAGVHAPYADYRTDVELRQNYSIKNAANCAGFYNDLAMDALAREHPTVTFAHAAPGFVATNWGADFNPVVRGLVRGLQWFAKSPAQCAAMIGPALTAPEFKGGFRLVGADGRPARATRLQEEARDFVWEHTKKILTERGVKSLS